MCVCVCVVWDDCNRTYLDWLDMVGGEVPNLARCLVHTRPPSSVLGEEDDHQDGHDVDMMSRHDVTTGGVGDMVDECKALGRECNQAIDWSRKVACIG